MSAIMDTAANAHRQAAAMDNKASEAVAEAAVAVPRTPPKMNRRSSMPTWLTA